MNKALLAAAVVALFAVPATAQTPPPGAPAQVVPASPDKAPGDAAAKKPAKASKDAKANKDAKKKGKKSNKKKSAKPSKDAGQS